VREKYDPAETTLREMLFGAGRSKLPTNHPGATYRGAFTQS